MVYRFDKPAILQLCVATLCLLVHLAHMDSIPDCLERFLSDPEICFVGVNMIHWHFQLCYDYSIECKSCIEVIELVARYFQKPNIYGRGLAAVAAEVGLSLEESPKKVDVDWQAIVFSDEQIKLGIQYVYACQLIGSKILAMLL
ncbi:hypothetical protein RHMOL_Rhmol05G0174000 [Rhododendron molle]|uniref:Uncharacterized protein n=1 Tax=Rhododendron molle TaxID=49168 RepID=A0ACC0NQF4_RHOML|nr:hypothetical protein RHMOL_Rhmol05G0174000 [Rhododendron molle]